MKKSILIIRSIVRVGGPGRLVEEEIKGFIKKGYQVTLLTGGGDYLQVIRKQDIKIFEDDNLLPGRRNILKNVRSILNIRKIIKDRDVTVIYGMNTASTLIAYFACIGMMKKCKLINSLLGMGKERYLNYMPFKHIVMSSTQMEELVNMGVKKDNLFVKYPSTLNSEDFNIKKLPKSELEKYLSISDKDILVGTVLTGNKGSSKHIQALKVIMESNPNIHFIFVGTSTMYRLYENEVMQNHLNANIHFLGRRSDIPSIMNELDIYSHFLSETGQETFGMPLTEAMAMKTPVVATSIGGIRDIVKDGETGYLIDTQEEYIEKILYLANNKNERNDMAQNSYKRAMQLFTVDKGIERFEAILAITDKESTIK